MQVNKHLSFMTVLTLLLIVGCSPLPPATNISKIPQVKLQSAQHWGVIAEHITQRIIENADISDKSLFIDERKNDTQFSKIFSKQLLSKLVSHKVDVQIDPLKDSIEMVIEVDSIKHPNDRDGYSTSLTALYANSWFIVGTMKSDPALSLLPTVVAADVINSLASRTNNEVVITTKLIDKNRLIFSESNTYYITDLSISQFKKLRKTQLTNKEF